MLRSPMPTRPPLEPAVVTPAAPGGGRAAPSAPGRAVPARRRLPDRRLIAVAAVVLGVGFLVRFALLVRGGGLLGIGAYDDGVYYSAAAQLLHGHLPYRDYLFVQPPGIVLALTPFAALAHLVGDPAALVTMRVAFELIGGGNAVLVLLALRRFGLPAAAVGGLFYAVFYPAAYDERTALLEPIGTAGVLVALLLLGGAAGREGVASRRAFLLAGVALGVAVDLKIWYLLPLVVLLAFARGGRVRLLLGAAAAVVACYLPFFLAAPVRSFTQIVLDQVGRGRSAAVLPRFESFLGVDGTGATTIAPHVGASTAVLGCVALLGAAVAVLVRDRRTWPHLTLLITSMAALTLSPSYFEHYAALVAPPLALVVGLACGRVIAAAGRRPLRLLALGGILALVCALNVRHDLARVDRVVPVAGLQAAARAVTGCIRADEPTLLAVAGVLTRDLDADCRMEPDMSGISFDPAGRPPGAARLSRPDNPVYQRLALDYLRTSAAYIAVRPGAQLSAATKRELARDPVLFADGPWVLHAGTAAR